jgi:hypothetical protein
VVVPVLGRPPQHALLRARLGQQCKQKLECPAGRIGSVREVPVMASPDGKDAKPVKPKAKRDRLPGDFRPNGRQASQMNQYEWYGRRIDDIFVFGLGVIVASFSHFYFLFSPAFDKFGSLLHWVADEDCTDIIILPEGNAVGRR